MRRCLFIAAALAAFGICLGAEAEPLVRTVNRSKRYPCYWIFSVKEAIGEAGGWKPLFIYFAPEDTTVKNLPNEFMYSRGLQWLSDRRAVFVLLAIPRKGHSAEQKKLLQKYNVRKIPTCIVADPAGNRMVGASRTVSASWVSRKVGVAHKLLRKRRKELKQHISLGRKALKKGDLTVARYHLQRAVDCCSGCPEHKKAVALLAKLEEKEKAKQAELEKAKQEELAKQRELAKQKARAKKKEQAKQKKRAKPEKK